jgi:hypothetical protein
MLYALLSILYLCAEVWWTYELEELSFLEEQDLRGNSVRPASRGSAIYPQYRSGSA